jgi:hypothetical protein
MVCQLTFKMIHNLLPIHLSIRARGCSRTVDAITKDDGDLIITYFRNLTLYTVTVS